MKKVIIKDKHNIRSIETYIAETIEEKVRRIVDENEPIKDGAPVIYQERAEGVLPEYDVRTDRWQIAINAMEKVTNDQLNQYLRNKTPSQEELSKAKESEQQAS